MARAGTNHKGGRPKGSVGTHTLEAAEAKKYVIKRVIEELEPMLDAQFKIAKKYGEKTGRASVQAFKELTERAFGKVTTVIGSDEDKPFIIQLSEVIAKKHGLTPSSEQNSGEQN